MVEKELLLRLYDAASMQRWNDQVRTVELTELDKQSHKMIIAYVLGKCEEDLGNKGFDWVQVVEGGIFEFLQRIVLTDLKPPLFHRIKEDREKYCRLNSWVYERIHPAISPLGDDFCRRFKDYLYDTERNVNRRIISAAHFYATKWEFDIIARANPDGYEITEIAADIAYKQEKYHDLRSMQVFLSSPELRQFVDICAQLRFQIRWSHLHRVPKTSVLGHMLIVAMQSYLFSQEAGFTAARAVNNYFTGLFHDLPEVLTRDIINPVKKSVEGLKDLIEEYERQEMEKRIYKLLPAAWRGQMRMFTEGEFANIDERDGALVKAADDLAAFIEAYLATDNGIKSRDLESARDALFGQYHAQNISGVDIGRIYRSFK